MVENILRIFTWGLLQMFSIFCVCEENCPIFVKLGALHIPECRGFCQSELKGETVGRGEEALGQGARSWWAGAVGEQRVVTTARNLVLTECSQERGIPCLCVSQRQLWPTAATTYHGRIPCHFILPTDRVTRTEYLKLSQIKNAISRNITIIQQSSTLDEGCKCFSYCEPQAAIDPRDCLTDP
jgi:hypothetical protein